MPHRRFGEPDELETIAQALIGVGSTLPAVLDLHVSIGVLTGHGGELVEGARDAAIEFGAFGIEPVEDGELSVILITGELQRRDLGVLLHRHERVLPRDDRLRVHRLHALGILASCGIARLPVGIPADVIREELCDDGAVRGRAHVLRHVRTDEIPDADIVLGEIVLKTIVQRVIGRIFQLHSEVVERLAHFLDDLLIPRILELARFRVEDSVGTFIAVALMDRAVRPYLVCGTEGLPDVNHARVAIERPPEGRRTASVV